MFYYSNVPLNGHNCQIYGAETKCCIIIIIIVIIISIINNIIISTEYITIVRRRNVVKFVYILYIYKKIVFLMGPVSVSRYIASFHANLADWRH